MSERYARLFLTVDRLQGEGRQPTPGVLRELGSAGVALEKMRFGGAEVLRVVLDRLPDQGSMSGADATRA